MKQSEKELNQHFKDFSRKVTNHIDGYITMLTDEIKHLHESLKSDYEADKESQLYQDLDIIFISGRNALIDRVNEFYAHSGDYEFDCSDEILEDLESITEEMEHHLRDDDDEDKISAYDKLKELAASYQLSDSQYHQDEILRLLEDEFGLNLVTLPAKNQ